MTREQLDYYRPRCPELADEVVILLAQLRTAGEQVETANRNHDDLRANCARVVTENERLRAALGEIVVLAGRSGPSDLIKALNQIAAVAKGALTPPVAKEAAANVRSVLTPPDKPYSELGSIEGTARSIDRDGRGHLILYIHGRLTGEEIKCFVSGAAAEDLGEHQIRDVWRGHRVQVYGTLHYKGLGKLNQVEAIRVRFLRDRSDLPSVEDIVDPDFTGGLKSEDYLARLRDGEPN